MEGVVHQGSCFSCTISLSLSLAVSYMLKLLILMPLVFGTVMVLIICFRFVLSYFLCLGGDQRTVFHRPGAAGNEAIMTGGIHGHMESMRVSGNGRTHESEEPAGRIERRYALEAYSMSKSEEDEDDLNSTEFTHRWICSLESPIVDWSRNPIPSPSRALILLPLPRPPSADVSLASMKMKSVRSANFSAHFKACTSLKKFIVCSSFYRFYDS